MSVAVAALLLNVPFLLCHPEMPVVTTPLVRSLAVNAMLFLLPGLPIVHLLVRAGRLSRVSALWVVFVSSCLFVGVLVVRVALRLAPDAGGIWSAMWLVTNAAGLLYLWRCGPPTFDWQSLARRHALVLALFFGAYTLFFVGATRIVPMLGDQDDELQGTAYGLIARLEPALLTGRNTEFVFAHPPLGHIFVAGSLVYYDVIQNVAIYDSQAPNPLPRSELYDRYAANPYLQETRTPNVFLAALTVALLGGWLVHFSASFWYAMLVTAVYATSPEIFVRSSYAGYFAVGTLFSLQMLMAAATRERGTGVVAGAMAAMSDHKTVVVPIALAAWEALRAPVAQATRKVGYVLRSPVILGFAAGTAVFWAYGLFVSPYDFWMDHVRHHVVDRVLNYNARGLDMTRYPGVGSLWLELLRHTGYLLVPLGGAVLVLLGTQQGRGGEGEPASGWRRQPGLWAIAALVISVAFSVIDWRQTKHLAPLVLVLTVAVGAAGRRSSLRLALGALLVCVLAWNVWMLARMANDFTILAATPEW